MNSPSYYLKKSIKEPELIFPFLNKQKRKFQKSKLNSLDPNKNHDITNFILKIEKELENEFSEIEKEEFTSGGIEDKTTLNKLYNLIREKEPETVVETGVCNGVSTSIILKALHDNSKGKLHSIDLPKYVSENQKHNLKITKGSAIPSHKKPGWLVPQKFKERWRLSIGDSNYRLPEKLEELEEIDIFLHDSEHTYQTMIFEISIAWRHLTDNGLILVDDFTWNESYNDFSRSQRAKKRTLGDLGALIKTSNEIK